MVQVAYTTIVFSSVCVLVASQTLNQLPMEDLYYELARQAREELAAQELSPSERVDKFREKIYLSFEQQGYPESQVKDVLNIWSNGTTEYMPFQAAFPNNVWLLWLSGWESAPWMVKEVAMSYRRHNPGWKIHLLDSSNIKQYVDIPYIHSDQIGSPAKSDIIRLSLLAKHGGVWADATMLCFAPLDSWIHEGIMPAQFFMYHGRDGGKGPASWFLASSNTSYIIQKWKEATDDYWTARAEMHDYFWMDELFQELMRSDPLFLRQWQQVPYLYCEAEGQAAMLSDWVQHSNASLKHILERNPPYVLKLSHHGFPNELSEPMQNMNGYHAILLSYRRRPVFHSLKRNYFVDSV